MKNITFAIRKKAFFLMFFCSMGGLPAQVGQGGITEQERMITGFTVIDVDDGIDVYIAPGVHASVLVKADHHLVEKLKTELSGRELKISMEGSYLKPQKLEVYIEIPVLEGISARGGSDIYATGNFQLGDFYIRLQEGSDLCLAMNAQKVSCDLSGGSDANLEGKVKMLTTEARGGSVLKASGLEVQSCKLKTIGGSDAYIWVIGELEMEALQSSGIFYHGKPHILHQKASDDSEIRSL
ncbi:head GIN domain-containing protein [Flavilitoribacter nigricans]|uniref:Putative auto-transporter adhesin head GIN domain-containing protein n=1 Tax=Flavilitoribacter nigricans (strain ATCC 23147 / DSM 23189 / NBRC 102662 / NCIMB 1420 / SS-2) TaxID=1122177 RepID=A0A2D0NAP5_FLAN2|nr:head GIN domain-containing protein [Flavilitoribacter nigricans]PHN05557.1 hypothetical protein CRP01_16330 [Flavilitoribacter nigricans DSM 23189 = NBRC 102662]